MTVVGGFQLVHIPVLPGVAAYLDGAEFPPPVRAGLESMAGFMGAEVELLNTLHERFEALAPDVVVFFTCDHLNTFFLDHVPSIAVGVDDSTSGPSDHPLGHPHYPAIPVDRTLAESIHRGLVDRSFDASRAQRFTIDHTISVPLHFLTPNMDVPVVPVWINGLGGVPIRADRARALGQAVRQILDEVGADRRVVVLASGAVSIDIGTPRVFPGMVFGVPDPEWTKRAADLVAAGDLDRLVAEATPDRIRHAGNAAAEVLALIALIAALDADGRKPNLFELHDAHAQVFAAWSTPGEERDGTV
jgi:gallate dioxygenase